MTTRKRHVYRVAVNGKPVHHYQTLRAAQHRAVAISSRTEYTDATVSIERSLPVTFFPGATGSKYRNGSYVGEGPVAS